MSVSSTRKNFSASMAITSLANLSRSLVESDCWRFNHLRQAAAIKFARQSWRSVISIGTGSCEIEPMPVDGGKADLGTIKPKGASRNYITISIT